MSNWEQYLTNTEEQIVESLAALLAIPSISADPAHAADTSAAADWIAAYMAENGLASEVLPTAGHPVAYGESEFDPTKPTLLFYGHYDVQPVDPLELWETPPFEPKLRQERMYGRGASDMKGNLIAVLSAYGALLQTGCTPAVNVKFLFEGEEEVGSLSFADFLSAHRAKLVCDYAVNTDSLQYAPGQPAVVLGLKGWCGLELVVETAATDLHSGLMGGMAPNALHAMTELLATLFDSQGRVQVPGFYDQVRPLTQQEREDMARIPDDTAGLLRQAGITQAVGDPTYTARERNWARPTLDINGMAGGFQGEGVKTIIPCRAQAKISCRLVCDQDPEQILAAIVAHLESQAPDWARIAVQPQPMLARAVVVSPDDPCLQTVEQVLSELTGRVPYRLRIGGSVAAVGHLQMLGANPIGLGFSLPDENAHAPNEFLRLDSFRLALRTYARLLQSSFAE